MKHRVFALILWLTFGGRVAVAELLIELALCVALYGGGGGTRIRRTLRHFTAAKVRLRAPAAA